MIKKGNLLRADRPLEPNKTTLCSVGFKFDSALFIYLYGALIATSTNLIRSENLSSTDESSDVGSEEIKQSRLWNLVTAKFQMTLPETLM